MAIVRRFKHGGVEYPLTSSTANSLLEDADPALYHGLDFLVAMLERYVAPRLLAQGALEGLRFPRAVVKTIHAEPTPFLLSDQLKFPIFCLYRSEDAWKEGNTSFLNDASVWEWAYILPPLTPRAIEQLNPIFRSVAVVVSTFAMQSFSPDYEDGATLRALSGIQKMTAGPVSYGRFEQISEQDKWWRAVSGRLLVEEQGGNADDVFEEFDGANFAIDLVGSTPIAEFVEVSTPPEIVIETISPISGPREGGTHIVIDGTGFRPTGPTPLVLVGGAYATNVVVVHPTRILAVTPSLESLPIYAADVQVISQEGPVSNVLRVAFAIVEDASEELDGEGLVTQGGDSLYTQSGLRIVTHEE